MPPAPSLGEDRGRAEAPSVQRPAQAEPMQPRQGQHRQVRLDADVPSALADKLAAAKPVVWRGKGDLPQYPWAGPPLRGSWLVLDLWAGFSGLCIALLSMGVHFYALAAESDEACRACAHQAMPHIVHIDAVENIQVRDLKPMLMRRRFRGIILGGGSPCQGNSILNASRGGLVDPRSQQPALLAQLETELASEPLCEGLELVTFLENVASMPPSVRTQYDKWMHSSPVLINAGSCGWVQRRRLYWLSANRRGLVDTLQPPPHWQWESPAAGHPPELRYQGPKPVPAKVVWSGGFAPLLDPAVIVKSGGSGAMHTFTREFYHPEDRVQQVSAAAAQRFYEDNRRFPPGAYEEHSVLWRGSQWRQPFPEERAQLLGVPPAAVSAVQGSEDHQRRVRNSLLGNGFHIPSVLAVFLLLPALLEAKLVRQPTSPDWELRERVQGTVWEPERLARFPDMLHGADVVSEMKSCFADIPVAPSIWQEVERRLNHCRLHCLQAFSAWCRMRGDPWQQLGPTPVFGRDRTAIFAGLSGQRYASAASRGLDHLLQPGLGPELHMAESLRQPSPFRPRDWPEPDVRFVTNALVIWQDHLPALASDLRRVLRSVATALSPLEEALALHRCTSAQHVAQGKKPAFLSCMTALLRWPDFLQGRHLLQGYPIVGPVQSCGVFREIHQDTKLPLEEWLGAPSAEAVDRLLRSGPPRYHEEIYAATLEEQAKGFCSSFATRADMDRHFGYGQWRPLERFMITQECGKQRLIDNARKTGHNLHTELSETITTTSVDFIASTARMVATSLLPGDSLPQEPPQWLSLRVGTDDLPDAYRGLPVCEEHLRFSVVAVFVPHSGWRFTTLWGLAYGLESAVVAFNRFPQLGVAITRRCLLGFAAAYFDDELSVEFVRHADVTQRGLQLTFSLMGAPVQPAKSFWPTANRHYLGTSVHTGDAFSDGFVRFQPKSTTTWKVLKKLELATTTRSLDRDTAGKLRGDLNWLWSMCAGHVGKLAGPLLTDKQSSADPTLDPLQLWTLELLIGIVQASHPRDVVVAGPPKPNVVVYSDASFEDGVLRLGWLILHPAHEVLGGTCAVPAATLSSWAPRKQQIYPGETLCGLVVPLLHGDLFISQDVTWYIDNEAATASLVRGSSKQLDVHMISQFAQATLYRYGARVWWEWIDSASNPSDGLSRLGIHDPWTVAQGWNVQEYDFPIHLLPANFLASFASLVV